MRDENWLKDREGNHQASQTMSCGWDTSWTPTPSLDPCDWVACLKPPTPPLSTNLRVSDWFGAPIQFGDEIRFVCQNIDKDHLVFVIASHLTHPSNNQNFTLLILCSLWSDLSM